MPRLALPGRLLHALPQPPVANSTETKLADLDAEFRAIWQPVNIRTFLRSDCL